LKERVILISIPLSNCMRFILSREIDVVAF